MPEWYESWFGEEYLALYPWRDEAEADRAVALIARTIGSSPARTLDLACGAGRHSKFLSRRWWTVGLDLSEVLLRHAQKQTPGTRLVRGDIRHLPFRDQTFGLIVNLFTSFGYFENDVEHLSVLTEVARVAERNATFVLDFLNSVQLQETLVPYDERSVNGRTVEQRREITDDGRFVVKRISIRGEKCQFLERVRLYSADDLVNMLQEAGFGVDHILGNYDGSPFESGSPRVILFAGRR